ncbi:fatty-acyl-CoA synthase [Flexivirga oryzae]|uniref:Fatty-acyl-CoA synthase n=1 Tax=Flexivirga oryzae TaxID=1794944 RepID=A0A839NCU6_9MICO|nr:fatty-acyl-CoA synthase [Flexivirga oryzae]
MASVIDERRAALEHRWGQWRPTSLAARFDTVLERDAARPFVLTDEAGYTYADLRDWSMRLARGLIDLGVAPGEPVGLLVDNRPELVALKLAVARVGAVAVPLNFSYKATELAAALRHAQVAVLVTISRSLATDFLAALDQIAPGWEAGVDTADLPALRQVVLVDGNRSGATDLAALTDRGSRVAEDVVRARTEAIDPDSPLDVVFTSGTSGHPVAAELTHDMVLRSGYGSAYHRGFDDGWRVCFSLPMYHVFGYIEGLVAAMFVGGAVVPRLVFSSSGLLEAMQHHRASEVLLVPTMSVGVVEQAAKAKYDLGSLESVFSAAAPAPVWLWERVHEQLAPRTVFTGYGQTEVSAATALTLPGDPLEVVSHTVGVPKLGGIAASAGLDGRLAEYRTLDPFTGTPLAPGSEGELAARGPIVTRAYHRDPEQTARMLDADGWLRSGDLGMIDDGGYLRLTGRARELFKVGGELVAPKEVEDLLTGETGAVQGPTALRGDQRGGPADDHDGEGAEVPAGGISATVGDFTPAGAPPSRAGSAVRGWSRSAPRPDRSSRPRPGRRPPPGGGRAPRWRGGRLADPPTGRPAR